MFEMIKQTFLAMTLMVAAEFAHAAPRDDINWMNVEVVIRGDYFRAAMVAYEDYSQKLRKRLKEVANPASTGNKELTGYLSRIEDFNIQVGFGHGRYNVWMLPRTSEEVPGVFGGDALYVIDAKEFKILEKHYGK
jgi:hypothetical protein